MPVIERQKKSAARFSFRLPSEIKSRVEDAALASGLTVSDFAINVLLNSADDVLERHEGRQLSGLDRDTFLKMLDDDTAPTDAMTNAVREYRDRVTSR